MVWYISSQIDQAFPKHKIIQLFMTDQSGIETLDYEQLIMSFLGISNDKDSDQSTLKQLFKDKITKVHSSESKLKSLFGNDDHDIFQTVQAKVRKLQVQFDLTSNENRLLAEQISKKNDKIRQQEGKVLELAQTKKQLATTKSSLDQALDYIAKMSKRIEDYEFDVRKYQKKLALFSQENKNLLATKASLQAERDKNNLKINTLTSELVEKNKKNDENKKIIVGLEKDVAEKSADIRDLKEKIQQLDRIITDLKFNIADKEEKLSKLEQRKNKQIKSLNQQILLLNRQMQTLKVTNDTQIHNLQQQIQKLRAESKKTIDDMTSSYSRRLKDLAEDHQTKERKTRDAKTKQLAQANARAQKNQKTLNDKFKRQTEDLIEDFEKRLANNSDAYKKLLKDKQKLEEQFKHQKIILQKDIEDLKVKTQILEASIVERDNAIKIQQELISSLKMQIKQTTNKMFHSNESANQQIYYLNEQIVTLKTKIQQNAKRDKKLLEDTVKEITAEHQIVLDSIRGVMMEQRQTEMNELKLKYVDLQRKSEATQQKLNYELNQLRAKYSGLKSVYQKKHQDEVQRNKQFIASLNERHKYELQVQAELKQREKTEVKHMYQIKIKAMQESFASEKAQINSHFVQEKSSALTKLKNSYEAEVQLIKRDFALEAKQKANQFERKLKSTEKKIADEQVIVKNLTKQLEKVKAQSKLKLESMTELHYRNEEEYTKIKQQLQQIEIQKEQQREQFQRCILRLETDIVQVRQECKKKEEYILDSCKKKISVNIAQMKAFADGLKQQMQNLEQKHNYRLQLLTRQYQELQYLYQQRTSKPEDIEALKLMHRAYIEKQLELHKEKETVSDLKRQITNKQATQKLFNSRQLDSVMRVTADAPFMKKK